ncbi:amidase family protein [Rhodococcus opacus]|uniref:amidase family protein n=1 Tax=Rhodococcus TaxID=1827 RepID=UPI001427E15E|nr:hypothetical protein GO592_00835 [Rhodococcus sp. 21391]
MPASCCGLVGLKPSHGRIPCGTLVGEAGFGHIYEFALTRTIRDTAHPPSPSPPRRSVKSTPPRRSPVATPTRCAPIPAVCGWP